MTWTTTAYDALVLAGGAARRLGGADKPAVRVGGRPLLDRVLAGCRGAARTVVVAAPRATARPVEWAREDPPGGGPVAALAAGLDRLATAPDGTPSPTRPLVLLLSADLPFFAPDTARRLVAALDAEPAADGAVTVDPEGREQPLVAVYRADALRRAVARAAAAHGGPDGLPLRRVTGELRLIRVTGTGAASFDCDTWEDIATARARIREHGSVLDEWITAVKDELGIDLDVDTGVLLDLARDAAHGVARPAAPLTTFLVGYAAASAAGAGGGGPAAVTEAAAKAAALAERWAAEQGQDQDEAG
ncbi:NTP transferase domain-containing protein [Streptomyces sp. NPDC090025]|uniref:NTP transferase domain-containing protein n=1 Tax=Streptomyces sp. NPDC090025 TaxID=3365922 RepID=UPI003834B0CE